MSINPSVQIKITCYYGNGHSENTYPQRGKMVNGHSENIPVLRHARWLMDINDL
jgi:hypothetical protein